MTGDERVMIQAYKLGKRGERDAIVAFIRYLQGKTEGSPAAETFRLLIQDIEADAHRAFALKKADEATEGASDAERG